MSDESMEPQNPQSSPSDQVPVEVVGESRRPQRSRHFGCLAGVLILLAVGAVIVIAVVVFGSALRLGDGTSKVREEFVSHNRWATDKVAIITVEGMIIGGDGHVKRQIDRVKEDEDVKAVVLRVNSPGGTVSGSDYIYHHLVEMRDERNIPVIVSMGSVAASGGYYVAMAVGETDRSIYAEPTTWTGSIGVVVPHYDATELCDKIGVEEDSVVSHPLKRMGSITRPMSEEEREIWQALVNDSFGQFKSVIREGRPQFRANPGTLDELATGQIFSATQAVENGLVDEIGFREDAVARAIEVADLDPQNVCVVKYKPEPSLAGILLGSEVAGRWEQQSDWSAMLELTTPRAYYLYGDLPALLEVSRTQ